MYWPVGQYSVPTPSGEPRDDFVKTMDERKCTMSVQRHEAEFNSSSCWKTSLFVTVERCPIAAPRQNFWLDSTSNAVLRLIRKEVCPILLSSNGDREQEAGAASSDNDVSLLFPQTECQRELHHLSRVSRCCVQSMWRTWIRGLRGWWSAYVCLPLRGRADWNACPGMQYGAIACWKVLLPHFPSQLPIELQ